MVIITPTETLTEIWMQCDGCRLTMFAGFQPMSKAAAVRSFEADGWTFSGRVLCDRCAAKAAKARTEEAS